MPWSFGESWDCYANSTDGLLGYWDGGNATSSFAQLVSGRFAGSQAIQVLSGGVGAHAFFKSSGANDAVHHLIVAYRQTSSIAGTSLGWFFQLLDGTTAQCSIVFRSDGTLLLASGAPNGTVLATYAAAVTAINTWFAFEIEVVIHNTAGSITVRKNGNTSNDFTQGSLNTRGGTANNYANRLGVGTYNAVSLNIDDILWRSDTASVPWVGDIRCYARMPVADVSVQFAHTPSTSAASGAAYVAPAPRSANSGSMTGITATYTGTVATATISFNAVVAGNVKAAIYDTTRQIVLATANMIVNPVVGNNTVTFPTPLPVVKGTVYYLAVNQDATQTYNCTGASGNFFTTPFASFPAASPTLSSGAGPWSFLNITPTVNAEMVNEPQQDGATTYVYDATPGHADLYTVASIPSTPIATIAVTARAFMQKSDAGTRLATVQLKSGATTVSPTAAVLNSSSWGWVWRTDLTDPNTGAAWTAVAVNAAQIGPVVVS